MLKAIKVVLLSVCILFVSFGLNQEVSAAEVESTNSSVVVVPLTAEEWEQGVVTENFGVTTVPPYKENSDNSILALDPPSKYINLSTTAFPAISGNATGSTLYSNNGFYGKAKPIIVITNYHKTEPLVVTLKKQNQWQIFNEGKITVKPGTTSTWAPADLNATTNYYLQFSAPSNFTGSVK